MSWLLLLLLGFDSLDGWEISVGARGPGAEKLSEVAIDGTELRLAGSAETTVWRMVEGTVPVRGGERVFLRVAARCRGIAAEGARFPNANALLIFDQPRTLVPSAVMVGDREKIDLYVHALAPEGATKVTAGFFLSMPGTLWLDDVRLSVTPGDQLDAAAYDALRTHLERTYPFFGVAGRAGPGALPAGQGLVAFLEPLHDVHVWIREGTALRPTFQSPLPWPKEPRPKERIGDIGYLAIDSVVAERFGAVEASLDALADCRALILDLRANSGGDERLAMRIASRFASQRVTYAKVQRRDPTVAGVDAFGAAADQIVEASEKPDRRRVIALQGRATASSAEGFALMLRVLDNVTTVGQPTRGASGNPKPFAILPDTEVFLPTWRRLMPDGTPIEGRGVPPEVDCPEEEACEKALALLR